MEFHKLSFTLVIRVTLVIFFSFNFLHTSQYLIAETDRSALIAFKNAINSPMGALSSWNESSHCSNWTGITCSRRHPGRVTILSLQSMSMVGPISPFIGNLSFLKILSLYDNHFTGHIPQEISRLLRLQVLGLASNKLTGSIPKNITSCTELKIFSIVNNELVGGIPTELGSLSKLQTLNLSENLLTGTIPVSLSNLSALDSLYLSTNSLHGNIPSELSKLSRLEVLEISGNNLSGTIPFQLFNISSISVFAVSYNKLRGFIPHYIGMSLQNLQYLYLGGNYFHGLLPNSISNISGLSELSVPENQFSGPVPPDLGALQALTFLNLEDNRFGIGEAEEDLSFFNSLSNSSSLEILSVAGNNLSGQLPDSVANLSTKLTMLYMGSNNIFGEIPPGIENLVSLNGLGMEHNQLTGGIPVSIGKLPNLVYVSLGRNQLSGQIPSNICNGTRLERLDLGGNRLQGRIPPSIGDCTKLTKLWLSRNQLVGTIPKQLVGLSSLSVFLDLSWNNLTGNLPPEVGNLEKIGYLNLSNNQLSGNIPSSLENCLGLIELFLQGNLFEGILPLSLEKLSRGIQKLDLSRNRLSGRIPKYLESFNSLEYLNLSSNDFEGELPKQGIFKNISAFSVLGNDKLCGGISRLHLPSCPRPTFRKLSKPFPRKRLLLIVCGVGSFVVFLGSFLIIWFWRRKSRKQPSSRLKDPLDNMFQKVSYKELLKATDGFSAVNLVGVGSYGSVYKALLILKQETTTIVAVKVLDLQRRGASKSFMAECEAMRSIRHRNLVKMLTSCSSTDYKGNEFKALVSEFMPNGNLENWLHPTTNNVQPQRSARSLSFMERLNVAIDVASALDYLHHHCETPIVHCDLKPSNVLLDDDMNGHVGDFGLAKFLGGVVINSKSEHHTNSTSVGIRGSIGYAAPEYGMGREVSTNGDVYSYGIMVLEMFTGKRPTDGVFMEGLSLHTFAKTALFPDQIMQIVDPKVLLAPVHLDDDDGNNKIQIDGETEAKLCKALTGIVSIGVSCSVDSPKERMEMVQVVKELKIIKNLYLTD